MSMGITDKLDLAFKAIDDLGLRLGDVVLYGHLLDAQEDEDLAVSVGEAFNALADDGFDLGDHDGHDAWEQNRAAVRERLADLDLLKDDDEEEDGA